MRRRGERRGGIRWASSSVSLAGERAWSPGSQRCRWTDTSTELYTYDGTDWQPLVPGLPARPRSIWGLAPDKLWVASYHHNLVNSSSSGNGWSGSHWPAPADRSTEDVAIRAMWGNDASELFLATMETQWKDRGRS